jgi:hypothetical protein
MSRPSETITAAVGTIVGAGVTLLTALGVKVPDGVDGPAIILVSWLAVGVTWYVARKQRAGELSSLSDGSVES